MTSALLLFELFQDLAELRPHQLISDLLKLVEVSLQLLAVHRLKALITRVMEAAVRELLAQFIAQHLSVHDRDALHLLGWYVVTLGGAEAAVVQLVPLVASGAIVDTVVDVVVLALTFSRAVTVVVVVTVARAQCIRRRHGHTLLAERISLPPSLLGRRRMLLTVVMLRLDVVGVILVRALVHLGLAVLFHALLDFLHFFFTLLFDFLNFYFLFFMCLIAVLMSFVSLSSSCGLVGKQSHMIISHISLLHVVQLLFLVALLAAEGERHRYFIMLFRHILATCVVNLIVRLQGKIKRSEFVDVGCWSVTV